MNKMFLKSIFFLSILSVLVSCEEKEFITLNSDANSTLNASASSLVLLEEEAGNDAITFSWTIPDFGFEAAESYKVLIYLAGEDYLTSSESIDAGNETSITLSVADINAKLLTLGAAANAENSLEAVLETKLSNYKYLYSNMVSFTATPYSSILDLSTEWGVVGSATPGGWSATPTTPIMDIPFWKTDVEGILAAYGTVMDGEVKFRTNNAWTLNYGDTGADGTLDEGGDNIAITAGTYKFTLNLNTLTYTIEPYIWGLVGSFNGWAAPDHKLTYNSFANDWKAVVTFSENAEVKFRFNEDWALNYGDTGVDGILDSSGDNILIDAGNYLVTFNPIELTYSFESMDVWGLVGSATPNGWDGPDHKFIPDFGVNEGKYYLNGVTLADGEIKVRQNDAWGLNYGDTGNDGLLEEGGDNIPVSAGNYNIEVNFGVNPPTIGIYPYQG